MVVNGLSAFTGAPVEVRVEDGRIVTTSMSEVPETPSDYLSPGLIDIQVNGYGGIDYSSLFLTEDHVFSMVRSLAKGGVTRHLPTVITASQNRILGSLNTIRKIRDRDRVVHHGICGVHIEGPYISEVDGPRGAHDAEYVRDPDMSEFLEWQDASGNLL